MRCFCKEKTFFFLPRSLALAPKESGAKGKRSQNFSGAQGGRRRNLIKNYERSGNGEKSPIPFFSCSLDVNKYATKKVLRKRAGYRGYFWGCPKKREREKDLDLTHQAVIETPWPKKRPRPILSILTGSSPIKHPRSYSDLSRLRWPRRPHNSFYFSFYIWRGGRRRPPENEAALTERKRIM